MSVVFSAILVLLAVVWVVLGIAAFVMGLLCAGKSASFANGVLALIASLLLGPFYFLFPMIPDSLCPALAPNLRRPFDRWTQ